MNGLDDGYAWLEGGIGGWKRALVVKMLFGKIHRHKTL
jgi:hypothetical protein